MKSQFLADFLAELPAKDEGQDCWTLHVDGSSNKKGGGAGILLEGPDDLVLEQATRFTFETSNNQAEYEALIGGLRLAHDLGVQRLRCYTDSRLVTGQINGTYQAKEPALQKYYQLARRLIDKLEHFEIIHVPREQNSRADILSKLASTKTAGQHRTLVQQTLSTPSWDDDRVFTIDTSAPSWTTPIIQYLRDEALPADPAMARTIRRQAAMYTLQNDELFRRGFSTPLLKCLDSSQAQYVLEELHRGICGMHSGARSMAARALRAGYYWPTMKHDARELTKKCPECQKHGPLLLVPPEQLHSITDPWPFATWGMDILGPFPLAKGQVKFLIVAIDYFTKWIEAEPLATITAQQVQKFTWKNVICRHGLPNAIVTDNGRQFIDKGFEEFLQQLGIRHRLSSVEHPQTNGQAEAANKVILNELKKKLSGAKGLWAEEIPSILWGYHCTPQSSTQETPFRMTYGVDAMIPVELGETSWRRQHFDPGHNDDSVRNHLDLVHEVRNEAAIRQHAAKTRSTRRFNSRVRERSFQKGDLVWRMVGTARKNATEGKLAANWDGPYRVTDSFQNGAYKLEELSGKAIPRTWNATHLKAYYS